MTKRVVLAVVSVMLTAEAAWAQAPYNLSAPVSNLATIFTDLFGPRGLVVDSLATLPGEQEHTAHFVSDFQFNFGQFSTALVSQLVSVPLPSPGGGFTYQFDPSLGVFQRTTQSFGPILTDRADTIGARHVSVGFAVQRFTFDSVENIALSQVPAVFTHDNAELLGGREDVVTTLNAIEARINQSTTFVTFGVTDRFDVSLAVPFVSTELKIVSDARIQRLGTTNELTHFYRQSDGSVGDQRLFTAVGEASGLGDIMVRLKGNVHKTERSGIAVGVDVRLPTGDEMNLLGSGTPGIQPFAIWSATYRQFSPHVNAGYKWNGSSVLAGDPSSGVSAHFPDQVSYGAGADLSVNPRLTLAFDLLGRYLIDAERLHLQDFHGLDGRSTFPNIVFARDSYNALSGAIGMKANVFGRVLVNFNLLFKLDENGLRDKVTPLIGFVQLLMTLHDSHCHFFSARFFEALAREKYGADFNPGVHQAAVELGWDPPGDSRALAHRWIAELNRHRLSRVALIASIPGDEDSVAAAVSAYPDRFVGFFLVNPAAPDGLDRARRAYQDLGLRCACLFPAMHRYRLDDECVARLFEVAAAARGALFIHCGFLSIEARTRLGLRTRLDVRLGDPLAVAARAVEFPSVPVILPHFGGGFFREALMAAEACPSIHFDTSSSNGWIKYQPGLALTDVFRQAITVAGPDRILFGSDSSFFPRGWRQVIHGAQRAILEELGIEDESVARIFGGNFARLFPA